MYIHYICIAGSHSYGTNIDSSDVDIRGWYFPDKVNLLGITDKRESTMVDKDSDLVLFSFHKFIHQLVQCNPNAVEWIGVKPEHQIYVSSVARYILDHPEMFLSKRVFLTFGGYANSMLKQIENQEITHRNRKSGEKIGKHMSHLLRLYYTGIDILKTGKVNVYMEDKRDLLLDVRNGEYTIEQIYDLRQQLELELHKAYKESVLPEHVDMDAVNNWVARIIENQIKSPTGWDGDLCEIPNL